MLRFIIYSSLILFISCSTKSEQKQSKQSVKLISPDNALNGKTESLELSYIAWGCACANWVTTADYKIYEDDALAKHCIFIEPANSSLEVPLFFDAFRHRIKVTGQFYVKEGYPIGTSITEEPIDKAKVFRYTNIEVVKIPITYSPKNNITLSLNYGAIACECAQWSESKYNNKPDEREEIYLERANEKLVIADTIYDGHKFPLQIQVTGQYIADVGYPYGYNPLKGQPKAKKVFRYEKIKVLKNGNSNK